MQEHGHGLARFSSPLMRIGQARPKLLTTNMTISDQSPWES